MGTSTTTTTALTATEIAQRMRDSQVALSGLERHAALGMDLTTGRLILGLPERLPPASPSAAERIVHVCSGEETLLDLAVRYYKRWMKRPIRGAAIIAQAQMDPIQDPFKVMSRGRVLIIPPATYIQDVVYGDSLASMPVL